MSGWTRSDESTPAADGVVLGFVPDGEPDRVWPVLWERGRWYHCDGSRPAVVTHWQPMPTRPSG
jgi:hypothetical protein